MLPSTAKLKVGISPPVNGSSLQSGKFSGKRVRLLGKVLSQVRRALVGMGAAFAILRNARGEKRFARREGDYAYYASVILASIPST